MIKLSSVFFTIQIFHNSRHIWSDEIGICKKTLNIFTQVRIKKTYFNDQWSLLVSVKKITKLNMEELNTNKRKIIKWRVNSAIVTEPALIVNAQDISKNDSRLNKTHKFNNINKIYYKNKYLYQNKIALINI